ncbi:hypothetical protein M4I17_02085 [Enterococcus thailandicus]|uniref:hypothetical protein n=1 Tax=Enterococcus thailandicus TaxID=417368 RepID=UPI002543D021|nr:hypothetical protein [Enterococcus thailandicus]MDK4351194.1 hypothetical protein [Enterococcus thailandicus]
MNKKMSELFHEFVHDDELNGNDEIIRETNAVVAEDDIEVRTMLDDRVGEKYFYRCMELAENVIKSFEDEQSQLNDNQKIVLDILKDIQTKWPHFHPSTTIGMMVEQQNEYFEELTKNQELKVYKVFIDWALEQEE